MLEVPRALFRELRKVLYYVPMAVGVLILTIVPLFNAFAPLAWFLLGAWMMSLQFVDYPMDNHRLAFRDVRDACAARGCQQSVRRDRGILHRDTTHQSDRDSGRRHWRHTVVV